VEVKPAMKPPFYWGRLGFLYFVALLIPACWTLALSNVFMAYGHAKWIGWAFAVPPLMGILSPLLFGAYAEQKVEAQVLLKWVAVVSSFFLFLAFEAIRSSWGIGWFFLFFTINAFFAAPISPLVASICLHHSPDTERDYPLVRLWGTFGWMFAGALVSWGFQWDFDPRVGWLAASGRLLLAVVCLFIPKTPPKVKGHVNWKERLGLSGLKLFQVRDYRVFFVSLFLMSIPSSSFYMSTPLQLEEMGVNNTSGFMIIAQILEVFAMFWVGALLRRFRIKWVMMSAIVIGVIRFFSLWMAAEINSMAWVITGVMLHGLNYTLFFVTAQVFLQQRVPAEVKIQAQAVYAMMTTGLGSALGAIVMNKVFEYAGMNAETKWQWFWGFCVLWMLFLAVFFLFGYQGRKTGEYKNQG